MNLFWNICFLQAMCTKMLPFWYGVKINCKLYFCKLAEFENLISHKKKFWAGIIYFFVRRGISGRTASGKNLTVEFFSHQDFAHSPILFRNKRFMLDETLQNLSYFLNTKTHVVFCFSFHATYFIFFPMNAECQHR